MRSERLAATSLSRRRTWVLSGALSQRIGHLLRKIALLHPMPVDDNVLSQLTWQVPAEVGSTFH